MAVTLIHEIERMLAKRKQTSLCFEGDQVTAICIEM